MLPVIAGSAEFVKTISDTVANVVTAGAVIFGGFWAYWRFVRERNRWPRGTVELVISHRPIIEGKIALNVKAKIHNAGSGLMKIEQVRVDLYRVRPVNKQIEKLILSNKLVHKGALEARWPPIDQRNRIWTKNAPELEPEENDEFSCDFFVSTADEVVYVYAYIKNVAKRTANHELGWTVTSFYDLSEASGKESADNLVAQEAT